VLVGVASSGRASATDSLGAVRLERVVPGPLTLRLASPKVSRAADEPRLIAVNVPDINDAEIVVSIPSADAIALRQCGDDMRRWGEGMVRIPSSARAAAPLTSVAALVRTPFIRLGAKDTVWVERQLPFTRDSAGAFYLCGVSRDATIQLAGTLPADALPSHFAVGEIVLYLSAPARP
jgi:hypothetical protein